MKMRTLGRTGVKVSPLCLGAMMFGGVGQPRPRRLGPDHPSGARRRHQLHRHRRRVLRGESEEIVGKALPGPARRRRAGHQGARPMGEDPNLRGQLAALDHPGGARTACAGWHRLDRPLPDPPARPDDRHRRDARRAERPGPRRARSATSAARPSPPRRSSRRSGSLSGAAASGSSASSRRTRSWCAASRPTCCRSAQRYGMGVIPWSPLAGGWLSGRYRKGQDLPTTPPRAADPAALRHVPAGQPAQARGRRRSWPSWPTRPACRSSHMALAFVLGTRR